MDRSKPPLFRLPIVVGVTGHRDVVLAPKDPTLEAPKAAIERELRTLLDDFPHSPIVVLSGLAEGADTLAAEVTLALAEDPKHRGSDGRTRIGLIAAMPMPLEMCAVDFRDPDHVATVARLRARAIRTLEAWRPAEVSFEGLDPTSTRAMLDRCYARLGAYLARNCHLLVALWDGKEKRGGTHGGTAETVALFEGGPPGEHQRLAPPSNPLRVPDGLRCVRVPCERRSAEGCEPLDTVRSEREKTEADELLRQLDAFNDDVARAESSGPTPESDVVTSLESAGGPGLACVAAYIEAQRAADRLARAFKASRRSAAVLLVALAAVALLAFELFAHGPERVKDDFRLLLVYVAAFAVSIAMVTRARRRRLEAKFLVYRSFAEALRVQCVWRGAGLPDRADDAYGVLHRDAIAWVRQGLQGLHAVADGAPDPAVSGLDAVRWARTSWIAGQIEYFQREIARTQSALERCRWWARGLVASGLLLALGFGLVLGTGASLDGDHSGRSDDLHSALIVAMVLLVAAGGLTRAWAARMAYEATIDRYHASSAVFHRAAHALDAALATGDLPAAHAVMRALGREALTENVGWVLLHRDHPLEIVAGG